MWDKDDYQEHMLGYLGGVQAEIEASLQPYDRSTFRSELDIAFELLWWLIGSSDTDWEGYRYTLEESCDELLRTFYQVPSPISVTVTTRQSAPENQETRFQALKPMEWRLLSKAQSGVFAGNGKRPST